VTLIMKHCTIQENHLVHDTGSVLCLESFKQLNKWFQADFGVSVSDGAYSECSDR
jgi:hypothetical protein